MIQRSLRSFGALLAVAFILIFSVSPIFAAVGDGVELRAQISAIKHSIVTVNQLESDGIITKDQAITARQKYIDEASKIAQKTMTLDEIMTYPEPEYVQPAIQLNDAQKFVGLFNFANIMYLIGSCLAVYAFFTLAGDTVRRLLALFQEVPYLVYEFTIFALSFGVLYWGYSSATNPYIAFIGALMVAGGIIFSGKIRRVEPDPIKFSAFLLLVWTPLAFLFNSSWIGFLAVAALLGLIGFTIIKTPKGYFGFHDESVVETTTLSGFIIMGFYVALHIIGKSAGYMHIFENGSLILGGIVGYCGLLSLSSRWYSDRKSNFIVMQIVAIIIGIGSIFIGSVFNIDQLIRIGGTFFIAYIFVKILEIPKNSKRAWATVFLIAGAFLIGVAYTIINNQEFFRPYILFLN